MDYIDQILQQKYDLEQEGKKPTKILMPVKLHLETDSPTEILGLKVEVTADVKTIQVQ